MLVHTLASLSSPLTSETLETRIPSIVGCVWPWKLILAKEKLEEERRSCQRRKGTIGACRSEEISSFGAYLRYKASCLQFILHGFKYCEVLASFLSQSSHLDSCFVWAEIICPFRPLERS